jgi:predicted nucleotidyltransferase
MQIGHIIVKDQDLLDIIKKYDLSEVSAFGSVLRDDFNENSDLDLLIVFRQGKEKSLFDIIDLKNDMEELIGRNVDIIEKEALKNPYRKEEILKTAKVIYAA